MSCHRPRFLQRGCAALLVSLLLGFAPPACAETLEWTVWPLPGVVNVADGKPTDGLAIEALNMLMARLPDLQPRFRLANRLRQQSDMQAGHNFCSTPLFRRQDSDRFAYFIPFFASTPIQAVIRRNDIERFPLVDGNLSLAGLIDHHQLRGGFSAFRTYPPAVDAWLKQAVTANMAESVTGTQSGENLLLMVSHGRIDYAFEFSTIIRATSNGGARLHEPLLTLPVAEDLQLIEAGIYCTRNEWGRQMATRLDQAIRDLSNDPQELIELYVKWVPEETYQAFATELQAYYAQRATQVTDFP